MSYHGGKLGQAAQNKRAAPKAKAKNIQKNNFV
jgi:hypothetical protein